MEAVAEMLGFTEEQVVVAAFILGVAVYLSYRLLRFFRWLLELRNVAEREALVRGLPVLLAEHKVVGQIGNLKVNGRIDEVRRLPNGEYILGDVKARASGVVREDDIVELSLYRAVFAQLVPGQRVSTKGYIRFVNPDTGAERIDEVDLYGDDWVCNLARAYYNVKTGRREARKRNSVRVCGSCQYLRACYPNLDLDDDDDGSLTKNDGFDTHAPGWSVGGMRGGL